ncbi:hypothetical protein LVD15_26715 [Fulvivirga maritima]|uniref:hypothetical protein n=1 Tax=Fulvivirga maritima TaxID=2904247 RepID=UPI001F2FD0B4|nr:hypothetical protein [Fulvivirga maritima]UII26842.1 hypothetical protein LVD15_26715 [Fulvivirga maritima]
MKVRLMVILLAMLAGMQGCDSKKKKFEWTDDIAAITDKNIRQWLRKAPFDEEWDPHANSGDNLVTTNEKQVFPFLGGIYNEEGRLRSTGDGREVFTDETVIFKDPEFGESFVHAALLYDPEEVFMSSFYSETGNVLMSGADAIHESYRADLTETSVYANENRYKTAIYWVYSGYQSYLMGFYQQGKLVFQVAFPCNNHGKGLAKLKEVSEKLGLKIKEWEAAGEDDLEKTEDKQSFWKDPYYGIYIDGFFPQMSVKIKNTPYKKYKNQIAKEEGVDYLFGYVNEDGEHKLSFSMKEISVTREQYEKEMNEVNVLPNENGRGPVYVIKQEVAGNVIEVEAETYFKDDKVLKISATYPTQDSAANEEINDVLTHLRISL